MGLAAIAGAVISVSRAIPIAAEFLTTLSDMWVSYKVSQIKESQVDEEAKRTSLMSAIQKAKTDVERIALSRVLHDFNIKQV